MPMEPCDLRGADEFLNISRENISSLVLPADGKMRERVERDEGVAVLISIPAQKPYRH
ncbi:hypothetical protein [Desulfonatronum lacustre]|uniref:hypothetical protein n=1 Tax=Desulfonatronum lacustre TaxID=66849 RepID=UPI0004AFEA39|nr:hypothetical protein [Desulfonatronum lacustre]